MCPCRTIINRPKPSKLCICPMLKGNQTMNRRVITAAVLISLAMLVSGCQAYFRDSTKRTAGETTDDRAIHAAIKTKLVTHGKTRGWKINVDVFRSTVTLQGYVKTEEEQLTALELARETRGVKKVDNKLVVLPPPGS